METKLQGIANQMNLGIDCKFDCGCGAGWVCKSILFKDEEKLKRVWFVVTEDGRTAFLKVCPDWVDAYFESLILAEKVFVVWNECHQIEEWFLIDKKCKKHPSPPKTNKDQQPEEFKFDEKDY